MEQHRDGAWNLFWPHQIYLPATQKNASTLFQIGTVSTTGKGE
jgi:hypothetical protein